MAAAPRLLDAVRAAVRLRHYSYRTEKAYVDWIRRFILFHRRRHPRQMGGDEVRDFLSHLANARQVSPATQAQALAALLFLYKRVLNVDLPWIGDVVREIAALGEETSPVTATVRIEVPQGLAPSLEIGIPEGLTVNQVSGASVCP